MLKLITKSIIVGNKNIQNYCNRNVSSHKFVLKNFNEIQIGDVVSSFYDRKLYRIYGKHIEEEKYINKTKITTFIKKSLLSEKMDDILGEKDKIINNQETNRLLKLKRTDIVTINSDVFIFSKNFLVKDKNSNDKYYHTDKLKTNDIILDLDDKNHYKIESFNEIRTMDYGGTSYDVSHYEAIKLDKYLQETQERKEISYGDFTMTGLINFPVIEQRDNGTIE